MNNLNKIKKINVCSIFNNVLVVSYEAEKMLLIQFIVIKMITVPCFRYNDSFKIKF